MNDRSGIYVRYQTGTPLQRAYTHPTGPAERDSDAAFHAPRYPGAGRTTKAFLSAAENHLIERLPKKDRARLLALCEPVELVLSSVICHAGIPTRHVYFPINSFVSLLTLIEQQPVLEVGMVGREGMVGAQLALGVATSPLQGLVQGAGSAWRIGVAPFRKALRQSAALKRQLDLYLYVLMAQHASSAACLRFHQIGPRLARWLLMSQDRAHASSFEVTQEFLSAMLGVRRTGVTEAASALQHAGLIEYSRGKMQVLDRKGLERAACSCYAADCLSYSRQLG